MHWGDGSILTAARMSRKGARRERAREEKLPSRGKTNLGVRIINWYHQKGRDDPAQKIKKSVVFGFAPKCFYTIYGIWFAPK